MRGRGRPDDAHWKGQRAGSRGDPGSFLEPKRRYWGEGQIHGDAPSTAAETASTPEPQPNQGANGAAGTQKSFTITAEERNGGNHVAILYRDEATAGTQGGNWGLLAEVVAADAVPRDVVRMGSIVFYRTTGGDHRSVQLVFPKDADIGTGKISIMTPIGIALIVLVWINSRFNYWEIQPNEILHHHGFLGDVHRYPTRGLRMKKEITDVLEFILLRAGTLVLDPQGEERPIVLENVIGLNAVEDKIQRLLGTLKVRMDSGRIGALFAVAVLFFFLRRFRMTLIITLSIPLSMLIALTVMYFAGETLNILSLLGLMICVGLLVDNSVVVAENIYRLHKDGFPRREACVRGAGEIALAITMATLTTVIVFLPVSLVEGEAQFFLLRLAIPVSVSLLASLFVALVFIPLAAYLTLPATGGDEKTRWKRWHLRMNDLLHRAYDATLERVNHGYEHLLAFFLRRRFDLILGLTLVVVVTGVAAKQTGLELVDQDENERPGFSIGIELPRSYTFEETEEYFLGVEEVLETHKEELDLDGYFFFHRTNFGRVEGWFNNPPQTELTPRQVTERALELLPQRPGIEFYSGIDDESGDDKRAEHTILLNGEDPDQLEQVTESLEEVFASVDGVLGGLVGARLAQLLALAADLDGHELVGLFRTAHP